MTFPPSVLLAGSERLPLADARPAGPADPAEQIEVTLITRRAASLPRDEADVPIRQSRAELQRRYGSDPADHDLVARVLAEQAPAIRVTGADPGTRRMKLAGPAGALAQL